MALPVLQSQFQDVEDDLPARSDLANRVLEQEYHAIQDEVFEILVLLWNVGVDQLKGL